ncbi:hypothetical protein Bca52824_025221 [Brassica carinata]|uniref:Uncharacterized protein n=1 Tax=Brassica carinata TaxID=52824 RepID=A0A8X7VLG3_BRACI|nr:hypothetical protein Bca52824_025221 [Brassica carinata]
MGINGGNMDRKSPETIHLQELTSNVLVLQAVLSKRRFKEHAAANRSRSVAEPVTTIDLTESKKETSPSRIDFPEVQKLLVEQMATSLTNDPNFTAALAAAVTGRLYQQNQTDK